MEDWHLELLLQVRHLQSDFDDLRTRLSRVEAALELGPSPTPDRQENKVANRESATTDVVPQAAVFAPPLGWAFLGLSGAYLLRAATESGGVSAAMGIGAGLLFAAGWLVLAARLASSKPLASTVYAIASVLILVPLVWEAVVRFHVFSPAIGSATLVSFTIFGLAVGWRHKLTTIAWVVTVAGLLTPFALFRETHDGQAWVASVLAVSLAIEFSACKDHWLGLRWVSAALANTSVLLLTILVATASAGQPAFASPSFVLGAQVALLVTYVASTLDRTLLRRLPISVFEIGQATATFVISVGGALRLAELTSVEWETVGLFCLLSGAGSYAISFAVMNRDRHSSRNFYTYSTFGLLLVIAGCRLAITGDALPVAWAALGLFMSWLGMIAERRMLRIHCGVLLVLAALAAGVPQSAWTLLTVRAQNVDGGVRPGYIAVLFSSFGAYMGIVFAGRRSSLEGRTEGFITAALFFWSAAGLLAGLASRVIAASTSLRTAVLTAMSLAIAMLAVRTDRSEFVWLAYLLLVTAGVKLFVEDLKVTGSLGIVVSLTVFGITLILLPRSLRASRAKRAARDDGLAKHVGVGG